MYCWSLDLELLGLILSFLGQKSSHGHSDDNQEPAMSFGEHTLLTLAFAQEMLHRQPVRSTSRPSRLSCYLFQGM
jgi:hypothetical protein